MKLGILVTTDRHWDELVGISLAAEAMGHGVSIFLMDEGTRLLQGGSLKELDKDGNIEIAYCELNARKQEVMHSEVPDCAQRGSQYQNLMMMRKSDRVICL